MNDEMKGTGIMKRILVCCAVACTLSLSAAVSFDAAGHVYVVGSAPVASAGTPGARFSIADWRGRPVGGGEFDAEGKARLPSLPTGYYRLKSGG